MEMPLQAHSSPCTDYNGKGPGVTTGTQTFTGLCSGLCQVGWGFPEEAFFVGFRVTLSLAPERIHC